MPRVLQELMVYRRSQEKQTCKSIAERDPTDYADETKKLQSYRRRNINRKLFRSYEKSNKF